VSGRRQLTGAGELATALARGEPVRLVLVAAEPREPATRQVLEAVRAAGIPLRTASERSLWRLGKSEPAAEILGLVGPEPGAGAAETLAGGGAAWLLVDLSYPGNTGFAIRCAEVSGADAVFIDCDFGHDGRREALRTAMRADRFMPVFWEPALEVIRQARACGRRILAVEDVGTRAPWQEDLTGPLLLLVGGERHGIPKPVLDACDGALRIPMAGFIPSYNVQAAMAMVSGERLRQLSQGAPETSGISPHRVEP
jgi:23S rRNA (guanosine2251-2'-O)-methyltransferase